MSAAIYPRMEQRACTDTVLPCLKTPSGLFPASALFGRWAGEPRAALERHTRKDYFFTTIKERSMRRIFLLLSGAAILLLSGSPASAGGGWWTTVDLHDQYLGVGESLTVNVDEILFRSVEAAEQAEQTDYFAYLVTEFDQRALDRAMSRANPKDWWEPTGPFFRAGEVTFGGGDSNLTRGRVHITVPEVPGGRYSLMLCDAGCRTPLANHIPVAVNVSTDAVAAQAARRLDRANNRLRLARADLRRELRQTERQLRQAEASEAEGPDTAVAPQPAPKSSTPIPDWIVYPGWFLVGAAASLMLARRRRKTTLDDLIIEHVPDDPRELTKTP